MNQELVYQTIKKFQDKLLDLSARNKLLNFKFSEKARTQIRIVNDSPDRIYKRLNEGKKLGLQTLPEPDSTPPDENSEKCVARMSSIKVRSLMMTKVQRDYR